MQSWKLRLVMCRMVCFLQTNDVSKTPLPPLLYFYHIPCCANEMRMNCKCTKIILKGPLRDHLLHIAVSSISTLSNGPERPTVDLSAYVVPSSNPKRSLPRPGTINGKRTIWDLDLQVATCASRFQGPDCGKRCGCMKKRCMS